MKKIRFSCFLAFAISFAKGQVAINPTLFGENAWEYQTFNATVGGTSGFSYDLEQCLPAVAASGAKYIRIGGIDENFFPLYEFNSSFAITGALRLTRLIDQIRANNMEPIIEVAYNPLTNYYDGTVCSDVSTLNNLSVDNQATIAGNLVDYLNNASTGIYASNPIRYWIIANEPDLPKACTPHGGYSWFNYPHALTDATSIATYIQKYSKAMKDKDNTIKIIGPELTTFGNDSGW